MRLPLLNDLSLRWKFMLAPVLGIALTILLAGLFFSASSKQRETLSHIQQESINKTRIFSQLATRLADNHAQIYELLKFASNNGDEARLYEMGKPLLNEVHRVEKDTLTATKNISSTNLVLTALVNYRKQIITAVEMSTVDLSLAYKFMTQATSEFNKANAQFLKLSKEMQTNIGKQLQDFKKSSDLTLKKYLILFSLATLLIIVLSYLFAKFLSRDLQQSINTLNKLTVNKNSVKSSSEVTQLLQVIDHVKDSYSKLDKTKKNLSQQETRLRTILDNMIDAVITINETGEVLSFNKSAERIFGYSADEMIGETINKLIPEHDAKQHDGYIQKYLKTGATSVIGIGREVTAQRKNNINFPIHLAVTELPYKIENKKCFIGSCKDITRIKQQEEQLRHSQKMDALGKLTGGIAHDYNNMLGVVLGYTELLSDILNDQPETIGYVKEIRHAGERGVKLTSKLLSFSRQKQTDEEKIDINSILLREQHMLEKTLTVRIKLILEMEDGLWPVKANSSDLEDSILNLCINAMHAMQGSGQLTIQTQNFTAQQENDSFTKLETGDYVLLNIIDTGHGIDEETINKIFDPFFTTKGDKGSGLGLSQVYGFIERSSAQIRVYSEAGHGSRFSLYFPRLHEDHIESSSTDSQQEIIYAGKETILTVDDEPALLNLSATILEKQGYKVLKARSARQALEVLESEAVDLLLSDIIMPEMDGYQLAAAVQEKYPAIKIQLTSGFSDNRHSNMLDESLHKNLINKPYNSHTLLKKIRELL